MAGDKIKQHQTRAISSPCFEPEECNNQQFFRRHGAWSIGLTFNIGLE
jgi:hypothetical protein